MSGSSIGTHYRVTTFGESHGKALGCIVDGVPAGLSLNEEDIQIFLNRRKPGQSKFATPRKEGDIVKIESGVFEGQTTGTPICLIVENENQRSRDYSNIMDIFRPGHADFTFYKKYGIRDYRGGGRSSGRETIGRVAAGAIASKLLAELGIKITTYTKSIGPVEITSFDPTVIESNPIYMPDMDAASKASSYLEECIKDQDSAGGIIECRVNGLPAGIGEPVFDKLEANLAKAIMSIGAVKGFEIGDGFAVANMKGSDNNDSFITVDGKITKETNHAGGTLGGMSDGSELIFRAAIKPTPSIAQTQSTVTTDGVKKDINIHGRHDPVIVPRAVVVVESMAAITILDLLMANATATLDRIKKIYDR